MKKKKLAALCALMLAAALLLPLAGAVSAEDAVPDGATVDAALISASANRDPSQFNGEKIAVETGTVHDQMAKAFLPGCKIEYLNAPPDLAMAIDKGKAKAYLADEPIARAMCAQYPNQRIAYTIKEELYAWVMPKGKPGSEKLCAEFNAFLAKCREDGTMDELAAVWLDGKGEKKGFNKNELPAENGTLSMAITSTLPPFCYVQDNLYAGYDIDLAMRFCRAQGYGLEIADYDASGLFTCLGAGRCDFAASCIAVTEERKETMLFSEPYYNGGVVVVMKDSDAVAKATGFFASIAESFEKTFVREDRYRMFLGGILTTLFIVFVSMVCGTVLGFLFYFGYYRLGKGFRVFADVLSRITENTPIVMLLMILYYVIFGSVHINGVWVSVIGFTLIFTCSVMQVIKVGVGAVDRGQREAALALGYTENRTLFRIILPQASRHFLPGYKSALVQLVMGTSVVGYIAVQDLTKISDIVRSRTYEAFFPLIVSAALYFAIAMLVTAIIKRIEINIDPRSRKKEKILKGVKTK